VILDRIWGLPPALEVDYEKRVQAAMREIAEAGLAESAHDVSDGGLAVTLAESSFGPAGVGAEVNLDTDLRPEYALFHEGPSRIVISTGNVDAVKRIAARHSVEAPVIGATLDGRLRIAVRGASLVDAPTSELRRRWEKAFEEKLTG
jgi:phosphoribosylformylglycinamidine synthase